MANLLFSRYWKLCSNKNIFCNLRATGLAQLGLRSSTYQPLSSAFLQQHKEEKSLFSTQLQKYNLHMTPAMQMAADKHTSHDHVKHWTAEKLVTVAMLGTIPATIMSSSMYAEYILAVLLSAHAHWGFEAIVVDYVRPSVFGTVLPKIALGVVYGFTVLTLGGLFYFIYSDVGIVNAIKMLWKL